MSKSTEQVLEEIASEMGHLGSPAMSDEVEVTVDVSDNDKTASTDSAVHALAKKHGWNAEGERSAEEFIEFALEQHPERGKQLKKMQRTLDSLIDHNRKQEKVAYDQAMRDLMAQRKEAIQNGDEAMLDIIDKERSKLQPTNDAQTLHPAIADFQERNSSWINGNTYDEMEMSDFARARDSQLMRLKLSPEDHVAQLEEHMHKRFPEYFGLSKKAPSPVEGGGSNVAKSSGGKKRTYTFADLDSNQKRIGKDFADMGVMTLDKYIADLVKNGELS